MVAIVATAAYLGLEARAVEVQVQLIPGLPAFHVVGLADKAVAESRERVRGAIADLAGSESVNLIHVAEALSYRRQAPRNRGGLMDRDVATCALAARSKLL
jgi:predicted ATPase with chaperone activity